MSEIERQSRWDSRLFEDPATRLDDYRKEPAIRDATASEALTILLARVKELEAFELKANAELGEWLETAIEVLEETEIYAALHRYRVQLAALDAAAINATDAKVAKDARFYAAVKRMEDTPESKAVYEAARSASRWPMAPARKEDK